MKYFCICVILFTFYCRTFAAVLHSTVRWHCLKSFRPLTLDHSTSGLCPDLVRSNVKWFRYKINPIGLRRLCIIHQILILLCCLESFTFQLCYGIDEKHVVRTSQFSDLSNGLIIKEMVRGICCSLDTHFCPKWICAVKLSFCIKVQGRKTYHKCSGCRYMCHFEHLMTTSLIKHCFVMVLLVF